MRFMDLPEKPNAKFLLLQIPFEHGLTYGKGTKNGPKEIVKASEHLEYYDEQYDLEPCDAGIDCPEPLVLPETPDEAVTEIQKHLTKQLKADIRKHHIMYLPLV